MFYVLSDYSLPCCPALAKSKRVPSPVSGSSIMYWSPEVPGTPWWSPPSCKTTVFGPPGPGFCVKTIPAVGSEPPEVKIGWVKKTCWPSVVVVSKLISGQVCFRSNPIKSDQTWINWIFTIKNLHKTCWPSCLWLFRCVLTQNKNSSSAKNSSKISNVRESREKVKKWFYFVFGLKYWLFLNVKLPWIGRFQYF